MPLTLSNRDQNSGHLFYHRRLVAAITRFSVRMRHDDRKQQAAVALSLVFVMIGVGWMTLLHWLKPAGLIGDAAVLGNRDTGQIYARLDGRLYPALNLTSARLAVAAPTDPTWVTAAEIARYPTGPLIDPRRPRRVDDHRTRRRHLECLRHRASAKCAPADGDQHRRRPARRGPVAGPGGR